MLVIRAGIQKMLVTIANREDPDRTASIGMGVHCLFMPFLAGFFFLKL